MPPLRWWVLTTLLLFVSACQRALEIKIDNEAENASPFADAGTGGTFPVLSTVQLDGNGSFDPDGTIASFRWNVIARPVGSSQMIVGDTAGLASIQLDAAGSYTFELQVTDNEGAVATSRVEMVASSATVVVNAGSDASLPWLSVAQLDGEASVEPDATVSVSWQFLAKPTGSTAMLTASTSLTPTFVADKEGTYQVRLTATSVLGSASDDVTITATVERQLLSYVLVDAEYSAALDRYIIASDVPPRLHIHDPSNGTESVVTLAESPLQVSLAPDGLRAAVAYDSKVAIVDLQTQTITATYPISIEIHDIVFGADNRVHCFIRGFTFAAIRTLDVATGNLVDSTGREVYGYTNARLHPSGTKVYGATTALSPADIERYDVSSSPVTYTRDSPYHGDYAMGGNVWFTDDGSTIMTPSGNLFYASDNPTIDMTYRGTLGLDSYAWITHSAALDRFASLNTEYDASFHPIGYSVRTFNAQLSLVWSKPTPDTPYNGMTYASVGRFIAFRSDSSKLYVIARAGDAPGVTHALYTYEP
jgi:hypothetical protein